MNPTTTNLVNSGRDVEIGITRCGFALQQQTLGAVRDAHVKVLVLAGTDKTKGECMNV
jgi:hypothetical protein